MNNIKKTWICLTILVFLIVFFIFLPGAVDYVRITEGAPIQIDPVKLDSSDLIRYSVDRLDPISVNAQKISYIWGWSFLTADVEQTHYDIYLVLKSDKTEYYFLTESFERPDLQKAFPEVEIDLNNSGFKAFIAKEKIQVGQYGVGIIYQNKFNGFTYYQLTNKQIVRTPNTFSLIIKQ
jgi:hypothetical protein